MSTDDATPTTPLRHSPLHERHVAAGARMAEFAGWEMPIDYGSVVAEHMAVRSAAGMFDLTHLGTVTVTGEGAEATIQQSFTNDVSGLAEGTSQYSLCLDEQAGIIDDLLVYRVGPGFLVVPNAANTAVVAGRLLDQAKAVGECSVQVVDLACVAVQGPDSVGALGSGMAAAGLGGDPGALAYLACVDAGDGVILSRSGYTGEVGFEVFLPGERAGGLWDALAEGGVQPAGLGCRDTLRLEMGYPLHGNDISTDTTPVEALLNWAVKPGTGFVGEEAYVAAKEAGASRKLRGIKADGRRAPRAGDDVLVDGTEVGIVTSGSFSPINEVGIGLAYLDAAVDLGTVVEVDVRGRGVAATVVRPPFVEAHTKD
ncbi:glycine cleavage system aminomethyltransferase GcvT [Euzebya tangerina]|uniref:glycine cleavage system aminomethyltransferase GcvT n=1 Tax=Euzebya tangerina TaxID=591198 RepID=UPI000E30C0D6|nr:glycine cleavage system aminomethyltransferase GcvT [Euzebya tangerina]